MSEPLRLEAASIANTNQLRRIAGTAQKLGLPYALDARINIMLDAGGLHLVMLDVLTPHSDPDVGMLAKCFVYLKLAGLAPDDPVPAWLSVRLRDYMRLEQYKRPGGSQLGPRTGTGKMVETELQLGHLTPDELSPSLADPAQPSALPPADTYSAMLDQFKRGER